MGYRHAVRSVNEVGIPRKCAERGGSEERLVSYLPLVVNVIDQGPTRTALRLRTFFRELVWRGSLSTIGSPDCFSPYLVVGSLLADRAGTRGCRFHRLFFGLPRDVALARLSFAVPLPFPSALAW